MTNIVDPVSSAPLTHRRVLAISLPILLANMTIPLMGLVDSFVIGQIPHAEPLAAVGIGAIAMSTVFWVFGFLRMGTTGLTAQADGADRPGEVAALLTRALMIGFAGGVLLLAAQPLIFWGALKMSAASTEVEEMARRYMAIRIWSAPAAIATFGLSGWLIGRTWTRAVMIQQIAINTLNMGLSALFVLQFEWGVDGVAWASFLADWLGLAIGLFLCRSAFSQPLWRDWGRVFHAPALRNMAIVNTDIMIRSLALTAMFTSFIMVSSRFGDATLAANQVLFQFLYLTAYVMDGFAFAAESLVGQAFGAGNRSRLRRAVVLTTFWTAITSALLSVLFWLFGPGLLSVMTKAPEVQAIGVIFLPWMIAAPPMQIGLIMLDGIFIGATRTADMRNMMLLAATIYGLAVWLLLPLGNHGLWLALHISFAARGLTLLIRYPALERAVEQT